MGSQLGIRYKHGQWRLWEGIEPEGREIAFWEAVGN